MNEISILPEKENGNASWCVCERSFSWLGAGWGCRRRCRRRRMDRNRPGRICLCRRPRGRDSGGHFAAHGIRIETALWSGRHVRCQDHPGNRDRASWWDRQHSGNFFIGRAADRDGTRRRHAGSGRQLWGRALGRAQSKARPARCVRQLNLRQFRHHGRGPCHRRPVRGRRFFHRVHGGARDGGHSAPANHRLLVRPERMAIWRRGGS